ncbi:helix-turn-helix domain-containing protein [Evansella sp. AB-rgal1]|uniref:helix-turn-helix domain-containing protein n=1 Tax=Evansella sp. AB-rgal1 TaxID=3242696 RepID=UPI00359CD8D1
MRSRSLFSKLIMFGCLISILPVIIVGTFSYVQSTNEIQAKVNEEKLYSIRQINSNVEQILRTVNHSLNSIIDSNMMMDALDVHMIGYDFLIHRELRRELITLQSMETSVDDIIIINKNNNWLLNNVGVYRLNEHSDREMYETFFDLEVRSSWVLIDNTDFSPNFTKTDCGYTVSLIKQLPIKASAKYGLAIANIPACQLADLVQIDMESEVFLIVDENQKIIVHHDENMIGKTLQDAGYIENMELMNDEIGQFDTFFDNNPYTVTYHQSDFNNWTYLTYHSIDSLTRDAKKIGWFTIYVMLTMIAISLISVLIISKRLYSPVDRVVKYIQDQIPDENGKKETEFEIIEQQVKHLFSSKTDMELELKDHSKQVQAIFLNRLFLGNFKSTEVSEKIAYFGLSTIVDTWTNHSVLTLQIDTLENSNYEQKDKDLLSFAVSNIVEESISLNKRLPTVWLDNTLVILIGFTENDHGNMDDILYEITEQLQENIEENLSISVSIGISMPFDELKKASTAYREGVEALKHRIKLGKGVIIQYSSINSGKSSIIYDYPRRTEEELVVAIKLAEKEKALENLDLWMEKLFNTSQTPREYQISMMKLLNNLLTVKQENNISFKQIDVYHESLYEELLVLQMKDEISEWFKDRLILPLINVFSERRDSQFHNLSEKIIDLIHKNYDTDITLEECAAKLHYNANYLSSVFKQETNHTFSEYLANYRFKLAKKWLTETDMTVKEIADKLKYNNSQNFIRSFKKQENMTPGQYRQLNTKES